MSDRDDKAEDLDPRIDDGAVALSIDDWTVWLSPDEARRLATMLNSLAAQAADEEAER